MLFAGPEETDDELIIIKKRRLVGYGRVLRGKKVNIPAACRGDMDS